MKQHLAPTPLMDKTGLKDWLKVSDRWIKDRLNEDEFNERCVVDIAPKGSTRRTIRYDVAGIREYLGMEPQQDDAAPTVPQQRTKSAA